LGLRHVSDKDQCLLLLNLSPSKSLRFHAGLRSISEAIADLTIFLVEVTV